MIIPEDSIKREQMFPGASRLHYIDRATGAGAVSMGLLTLEPGGALPLHKHRVEDAMIVLEGEGVVVCDGVETTVRKGMGIIAPANSEHTIRNDSDKPFTIVYAWPSLEVERFVVKPL